MAWVGSILLLILSIVAGFTIGLFALPGAIVLLIGAILKSFEKKKEEH
jgi:hypothetical protein